MADTPKTTEPDDVLRRMLATKPKPHKPDEGSAAGAVEQVAPDQKPEAEH